MLKTLNKNDTQLTPFLTTNDWILSNKENSDLILMEHSGSDGLPVAIEYIDYNNILNGNPTTSSACNLSLEQQSLDLVSLRDGLNLSGIFYPDLDPVNSDGTYQRSIYSQVSGLFYNNYKDPTKIWGSEVLDFELSQTKRFISDKFTLFSIPKNVFGQSLLKNSVILFDTTTDNNYTIVDDGNCNLFAGTNLFSRQQELGEYKNTFYLNTGSNNCLNYLPTSIPDAPVLYYLYYNNPPPSVLLQWNFNYWNVDFYSIKKSIDGIHFSFIYNQSGSLNSYKDTMISYNGTYWYQIYAINSLGTSSVSNTINIYVYH